MAGAAVADQKRMNGCQSTGSAAAKTWGFEVVQAAIRRWSSGHFNYTDAYDAGL